MNKHARAAMDGRLSAGPPHDECARRSPSMSARNRNRRRLFRQRCSAQHTDTRRGRTCCIVKRTNENTTLDSDVIGAAHVPSSTSLSSPVPSAWTTDCTQRATMLPASSPAVVAPVRESANGLAVPSDRL